MANSVNVKNLQGELGGQYATSGTITPANPQLPFAAIFAHAAAVLTATSSNISGTLVGVALPAGAVWYGAFSSITVTSGAVTAYYGYDL